MSFEDGSIPEDEWDDESGPFCEHWQDMAWCDRLCVCGAVCAAHNEYGHDATACDKFTEANP